MPVTRPGHDPALVECATNVAAVVKKGEWHPHSALIIGVKRKLQEEAENGGCISGQSHGHSRKRYELNQTDGENRRAAVSGNGVTGSFGIIYVPSRLIVSGNASATASNILASEWLFRLGIVSEMICAAEFIFLVWALYRLLGGVNKTQAWLMVSLGLVFVPFMLVNTLGCESQEVFHCDSSSQNDARRARA